MASAGHQRLSHLPCRARTTVHCPSRRRRHLALARLGRRACLFPPGPQYGDVALAHALDNRDAVDQCVCEFCAELCAGLHDHIFDFAPRRQRCRNDRHSATGATMPCPRASRSRSSAPQGLCAIRGHRRYYAAILSQGQASIVKRRDAEVLVLASVPFAYAIDDTYNLELRACGTQLALIIDGLECVRAGRCRLCVGWRRLPGRGRRAPV